MKYIGIALAILIIAAATVGGIYWYRQKNTEPNQVERTELPAAVPTPAVELTAWTDPAQFTFQYPKNITIDPHKEDTVNYANVELTDAQHPGHIIVWAKDTTAQSIDDWVKKEKAPTAIDTTLGGLPAKKTLGEKENTQMLTTVRNGYLYQIETDGSDRAYWEPVLNQVTASFAFKDDESGSPESAAPPSVGTESSGGDTEEETIE